jgi:hypothetical protein
MVYFWVLLVKGRKCCLKASVAGAFFVWRDVNVHIRLFMYVRKQFVEHVPAIEELIPNPRIEVENKRT